MRWKKPERGATKTRRKFALFPRQIGQFKIWLEFYKVQYTYDHHEDKWRATLESMIDLSSRDEREMGGEF